MIRLDRNQKTKLKKPKGKLIMKNFTNTIYNVLNNKTNTADIENAIDEIERDFKRQCQDTIGSIESLETETNYFNMSDCEINSNDYNIDSDIDEIDNTIYEAQESINFAQNAVDDLETLISYYKDFMDEQENNIAEMEDTKSEIEEQLELLEDAKNSEPDFNHINYSLASSAMAHILYHISDEYGFDFLAEYPIQVLILDAGEHKFDLSVRDVNRHLTLARIEFNDTDSDKAIRLNKWTGIDSSMEQPLEMFLTFNHECEFEYNRTIGIFKNELESIAKGIANYVCRIYANK